MPSPFTGMDPYLEDPALWPDVHHSFISVSRELPLEQLRPKYFVQVEERLYLANENDAGRQLIVPDLRIRPGRGRGKGASNGLAVAVAPTIGMTFEWEHEFHEAFLQVIDREANRVVTAIEILRPTNKIYGAAGRRSYDDKRQEILLGRTNLVEIDLLREGIPLMVRSGVEGRPEYMAQSLRFEGPNGPRRALWAMPLREKVKAIAVPVRPQDPDAVLDLQAMLDIAYDRAGYDLRVDYAKHPIPPLPAEDVPWAKQVCTPFI